MLPAVAFSSFQSRYQEPSLKEGFQDILKVDFQVWVTHEVLGFSLALALKIQTQALTAITMSSSKGRPHSNRPGLATGSSRPSSTNSTESFCSNLCYRHCASRQPLFVAFTSSFLCILEADRTTWRMKALHSPAQQTSLNVSYLVIFCCSFPSCISEYIPASGAHWPVIHAFFNGRRRLTKQDVRNRTRDTHPHLP